MKSRRPVNSNVGWLHVAFAVSRQAMTMSGRATDQNWEPNWVILFVPPLLLFIKDFIAISAMLVTEPGITARTKMYFIYSQLPGVIFFDDFSGAIFFNYILAFVVGGVLWFIAARRSRRRGTQQIRLDKGA
jgi:hypothetical protein